MDQTDSYPVKLYIYDLSRGMARQLSPLMLGKFLTSYLLVGFMALDSADIVPRPELWLCFLLHKVRIKTF